ncbi:MAG TPA: 4'-phosphopantetheinyl transferase superfamily protein, partial [Povalibacter sp.]|nr:4'-phosphopantetheinyl transferase superfamily protein [Povalibacter sp.]
MQAPIPSARQVISGNEPGASAARVALWLASPLARRHFDPSRLNDADAGLSRTLRNPDRAEEFVISRSLQQYLATPATTPQSLSHSGRYAALALAPAGIRVGVDIEQHRPRDLLAIARFAFAAEESAALAELEGAALEQEFYARWVMKEAMAKALQLPLLVASRECR